MKHKYVKSKIGKNESKAWRLAWEQAVGESWDKVVDQVREPIELLVHDQVWTQIYLQTQVVALAWGLRHEA